MQPEPLQLDSYHTELKEVYKRLADHQEEVERMADTLISEIGAGCWDDHHSQIVRQAQSSDKGRSACMAACRLEFDKSAVRMRQALRDECRQYAARVMAERLI